MTNGEKIQHDFECEVCEPIIEDNIIHVMFADKSDSAIGFDWDWWNAEYQELGTLQIFTEEDVLELKHRYGDEVEYVVRDMLSGEGKRWNKLPFIPQKSTRMIDNSDFDQEQYKSDLQSAYDCGKSVLNRLDKTITDALDKSVDQKESQTLRWVLDKISEITAVDDKLNKEIEK